MKKILIYFSVFFISIIIGVYFAFWPKVRFELAKEAVASGGFPYQIGLNSVTVTQCQLSCCSAAGCRCCIGGTLCTTITTEPQCVLYSDVSGAPAGGMGSMALFTNTNLGIAGVSNGGSLIAGGTMMTQMDSGVLVGVGGCSGVGCTAINNKNIFQKYYEIIKYGIASFKD